MPFAYLNRINTSRLRGELLTVTGKEWHYFAGGNTAKGFYSQFDSNFAVLEKVFILKGGPGNGKSTMIKNIARTFQEKGYDVEYIHCSSDSDSIDGIIFPALSIGIVDGTAPHIIEPKVPGAIEEYVNLGCAWDSQQLSAKKDVLIHYINEKEKAYELAYQAFAEALAIHDEWESIYISNMDYEKLNSLTEELNTFFFREIILNKESKIRHRFLGAATPKGAVDFIPNLTVDIRKRYFLKGRPGSGKSTLLKKIANAAESKGFDVEIYHCGFDPNSLDMLIFRELGIAIFDSTAPHEYFPDREGDEIIDLYKIAIYPETDEMHEKEISTISARYREKMNEGTAYLAEAKKSHDQLEAIYKKAVDFKKVDEIQYKIEEKIKDLINNK